MFARPATHAARVARVGAAVQERGCVDVPERRANAIGDDDRAERHVARADPLRARHQVGREAVALAAEPATEAAEAGDDLVCDQEDASLAADRSTAGQ